MTHKHPYEIAVKALETYGSDFNRWPDQDLANYARNHPDLAAPITQAARLDEQLGAYQPPAPSRELKAHILAQLHNPAHQQGLAGNMTGAAADTAEILPLRARINRPKVRPAWMKVAALFLFAALACGYVWTSNSVINEDTQYSAALEAETDIWLNAANELDMADIFLWVETDDNSG